MKHAGGDGSPLHLPVSSLGLSNEFTLAAMEHGFNTLADFQMITVNEMLAMEWFTSKMFKELLHLLKQLHKLVS